MPIVSRLEHVRYDQLDDRGRAVWDYLLTTRGASATNDSGFMVGPFNAWVQAPDIGAHLANLGTVLRFGTSLNGRLLELAIITVGAHWKSEFEWWVHAGLARKHGLHADVIEAVGRGDVPQFETEEERVVHEVALQLVTTGRLEKSTYQNAEHLLGKQGMIELVSLCGYYALVSFTLNAFNVSLPAGVSPFWD